MKITPNELNSVSKYQSLITPNKSIEEKEETKETKGSSFADTMNGFLHEVNKMQNDSSEMTESFIKGEDVNLHDVMIAGQKAKTTFQLLIELRNKGLDLYREIQRMQV